MDQWPGTKLGRFIYDAATVLVAVIGLYLFVGGILVWLAVLIGVQYVVFRAVLGKPEKF